MSEWVGEPACWFAEKWCAVVVLWYEESKLNCGQPEPSGQRMTIRHFSLKYRYSGKVYLLEQPDGKHIKVRVRRVFWFGGFIPVSLDRNLPHPISTPRATPQIPSRALELPLNSSSAGCRLPQQILLNGTSRFSFLDENEFQLVYYNMSGLDSNQLDQNV